MSSIETFCKNSRKASLILSNASTERKNRALQCMADSLRKETPAILKNNKKDLKNARDKKRSTALVDRLALNKERIEKMAHSLEEVIGFNDPIGEIIDTFKRPNGLQIQKIRIPIGVIAIIYESRPNVTTDAAGLCLKSGNCAILRGGSESQYTNRLLAKCLAHGLEQAGLPKHAIQIPPSQDRKFIDQLLKMEDWVDLVIPRGGEGLIRRVVKNSRIPVLKHYKGVCHVYIDESADAKMAEEIVINAKVQRPGVCNAMETLLIHRKHQKTLLPKLIEALQYRNVEIRGTPEIKKQLKGVRLAKKSDWSEEYLDLILSVKMVQNLDEALAHIRTYGTNHTEAIVTANDANAARFLKELHSSVVLVNASTRFADGGEMGMGAEIGISTSKLHAFGPMGLEDLTIGHYAIQGTGQIRN